MRATELAALCLSVARAKGDVQMTIIVDGQQRPIQGIAMAKVQANTEFPDDELALGGVGAQIAELYT